MLVADLAGNQVFRNEIANGIFIPRGGYLPHLGDNVEAIHLVEPDPFMVRRLREALSGTGRGSGPGASAGASADARGVPRRSVVHEMGAETLPFADASIDTVLTTLTLCTVDDLEVSAQEIRRVLRPGGSLLVLEHVRSINPRIAAWQKRWRKPWRWAGAGCTLDRESGQALAGAGFETRDLRRVTVPDATASLPSE